MREFARLPRVIKTSNVRRRLLCYTVVDLDLIKNFNDFTIFVFPSEKVTLLLRKLTIDTTTKCGKQIDKSPCQNVKNTVITTVCMWL